MPNSIEICKGTKHSNTLTTDAHETGKLLSKIKSLQARLEASENALKEEMNAKNKAYYFIISSGKFKRFANFCKKHTATLDYHGACVAELYIKAVQNEK